MSYARRSRFVYGDTEFETELSAKPWTPGDVTVGGTRTAAAGIPASYIVRRDTLYELPLRVSEAEWPAFRDLIAFGQSAETFLWLPDADFAQSLLVYLESPKAGEQWAPSRMADFERVFDMTITLRLAEQQTNWVAYFEE